jgi:hypothetical protein
MDPKGGRTGLGGVQELLQILQVQAEEEEVQDQARRGSAA